MTVMDVIPSEPLRLEQSVGQVNEQPERDEGGERIIEGHGVPLKAGRTRKRSRSTA